MKSVRRVRCNMNDIMFAPMQRPSGHSRKKWIVILILAVINVRYGAVKVLINISYLFIVSRRVAFGQLVLREDDNARSFLAHGKLRCHVSLPIRNSGQSSLFFDNSISWDNMYTCELISTIIPVERNNSSHNFVLKWFIGFYLCNLCCEEFSPLCMQFGRMMKRQKYLQLRISKCLKQINKFCINQKVAGFRRIYEWFLSLVFFTLHLNEKCLFKNEKQNETDRVRNKGSILFLLFFLAKLLRGSTRISNCHLVCLDF